VRREGTAAASVRWGADRPPELPMPNLQPDGGVVGVRATGRGPGSRPTHGVTNLSDSPWAAIRGSAHGPLHSTGLTYFELPSGSTGITREQTFRFGRI